MKRIALVLFLLAPPAYSMSIEDLACGAKLCLAGDGGSPCAPYLKHYKSIDGPTRAITKRMRKAFLALCKDQKPPDMEPYKAQRALEMKKYEQELENGND